jgi:hypothetical protein
MDITHADLRILGRLLGFEHLEPARFFPQSYPASGIITKPNCVPVICLACASDDGDITTQPSAAKSAQPSSTKAVNIIFIVEPSSPVSHVSHQAMKALMNSPQPNYDQETPSLPAEIVAYIHHKSVRAKLHLLPAGISVNVLGLDFLVINRMNLCMNFSRNTFQLVQAPYY